MEEKVTPLFALRHSAAHLLAQTESHQTTPDLRPAAAFDHCKLRAGAEMLSDPPSPLPMIRNALGLSLD